MLYSIPKDKYTLVNPDEEWKTCDIENYDIRELQVPIFKDGKQVYEVPTVKERKDYCTKEFKTIYPEIKRKANPHKYYVDLSEKLLNMKKHMIREAKFSN